MKNKIKKAPIKFREDLLYFQQFMLIFCLCPKLVIITTLNIFYLFCKYVSRLLITFEDQGKYWHILLHSILIWKEENVTLRDLADDVFFFAFLYAM